MRTEGKAKNKWPRRDLWSRLAPRITRWLHGTYPASARLIGNPPSLWTFATRRGALLRRALPLSRARS